jgi:hypothetical protein
MQSYNFWDYIIQITEKTDFDIEQQRYPTVRTIHCKQIHSNTIYEYQEPRNTPEWDGIFSNKEDITLSVWVSDCNAVVIMGQKRYWILHAGRKGLRDGIIQTMINQLKEKGESDFTVLVWPSIRACCYEVGEEFTSYFNQKYLTKQENEKYKLDMISVIQDILKSYNISNITVHPTCTKCSSNFFSYRNWDGINNIVIIQKK